MLRSRIPVCVPAIAHLFAAAVCPAQSPAPAESPKPAAVARIAWEHDYDAAVERAAATKKPLLVVFLMDDEPGNDAVVKDHYNDPRIVELLGHFVCLVGCLGEHAGAEPGCAKFPGLQCEHHRTIEKKARARWLTDDLVCTPQHICCDPQGKVLYRKIYLLSKPALARVLLMTLQDCGVDTSGMKVDFGKEGGAADPDDERDRVGKWLTDLDSRNLEVRETALRGLGYADDPRALRAVIARCDPKHDDATRLAAIGALGRKGNHEAVPCLTKLLGDGNAMVLAAVASALETIELPTATPALVALMKKEKRDRVLGGLVRAAAKTDPADAGVRDYCLKRVKGASNQLQASLLIALGRLDSHDKIVAALVPLLASKNQNTRGLAVWALGNQRTQASAKALQDLQKTEKSPEVVELLQHAVRRSRGEVVDGYDSKYWRFFSSS
jgi:hypothetical protein